jgi:RNA polymerase sigma-54 factor
MELKTNQSQQLLFNLTLQKALCILQMPVLELAAWIDEELSLNPAVEIHEGKKPSLKSSMSLGCFKEEDLKESSPSLFTHIMRQAPLYFQKKEDLAAAEFIAGSLNEYGFLEEMPQNLYDLFPMANIDAVIAKMQRMDPVGIASRDLKECFLIQLQELGKENSLAYSIISDSFQYLLQQRFTLLAKKYKVSEIMLKRHIKETLKTLQPYPGKCFGPAINHSIIADVIIEEENGKLSLHINESQLSSYILSSNYRCDKLTAKDISFLESQRKKALWIFDAVKRRKKTLTAITNLIVTKQKSFFLDAEARLFPVTLTEAAEELSLHPSTVARAVSGKYLLSARGIFPLKAFFSQPLSKTSSEISSSHARMILEKIIKEENKHSPLSDQELVKKMQRQGFHCARRTVTKYRRAMKIETASKRKGIF